VFVILPILISYLLGAIPIGLIVARLAGIDDIRTAGSGNIGATNVWRVAGWRAAVWVFAGDIGKGVAAVVIGRFFAPLLEPGFLSYELLLVLCGLAAVLGHVFPVYLRFKGGKGVNTALGMLIVILPAQTLLSLAIFLVLVGLTRYVSLGSIGAAVALGVILIVQRLALDPTLPETYLLLGTGLAILVVFTHRRNISRLLAGTENRLSLTPGGENHGGGHER
jgi:glycerol-3-phosphate acyltransferase PlsY